MTENQEFIKAITEANKPMLHALNDISRQLRTLVCVQMTRELYEEQKLRSLIQERKKLSEDDRLSYEQITEAGKNLKAAHGNVSFEERVRQFGEEAAREQGAPMDAALDVRKVTMRQLDSFDESHPLIAELMSAERRPDQS